MAQRRYMFLAERAIVSRPSPGHWVPARLICVWLSECVDAALSETTDVARVKILRSANLTDS